MSIPILKNRGSAAINRISKGEREVQRVLRKHHIKHFRETRFDGCRSENGTVLPFDLSIYLEDELVALIEYQGVQHFIGTFSTEDWVKTRATDEIKRNFCKENGIPLLEVPYYKFREIDKIVTEFLRKHGILKRAKDIYYNRDKDMKVQ